VSKRIALIPARGGSKRLLRKNILDFHGKPMMAYSIQAALQSKLFDQVVVSTEDDEISEVALQYGAAVDYRSSELASDNASVKDVCLDFLNRQDQAVSLLAVLYATAPLRDAEDVRSVVNLLSDQCHFALATTLCDWPAHQTLKFNKTVVSPLFPDLVNKRTDEVDQYCVDNGSTYAVDVAAFRQQKTFYGDSLRAYLMPSSRSFDIDTQSDFDKAMLTAEKLFE